MTFQVTIMFVLGSMSFLVVILNVVHLFDRLIRISRMVFLAAILNCDFRFQTSKFK